MLWEFTSADDPDLGFTYSQPSIALTNAGTWVAIFGNGYNDTGLGQAQLFIVDIEKGIDGWQAGDVVKLNTRVGSPTVPNGLATPALVDLDNNGTVDRVYAGDTEGNMWAFDLSGTTEGSWEIADLPPAVGGVPATPVPLFSTPSGQPITATKKIGSSCVPTGKRPTSPPTSPTTSTSANVATTISSTSSAQTTTGM